MLFQNSYLQHYYSGFEPSQAFDVVYGTSFEHRLLSAKRTSMKHQRLTLGDIRLETGWYNFPVIARGSMPKSAICIGFMAEGADATRINTTQIATEEIQIYPAGVELLYHAASLSRWVNFVVPEARLQKMAIERTGYSLTLLRAAAYSIRLPVGGRRALTRITDDALNLARRLQSTGGMTSDLAQEIYGSLLAGYVDALFDAVPSRKSGKPSIEVRHHHLINACERLVLAGTEADVALADIAKRSGYSMRSLQLIFRRSVGMTPGRWFMTARLNGALRDLLMCDQTCTVSEVAMKWGFRHMSRFSHYYQKTFGELPSQTLNRSRVN